MSNPLPPEKISKLGDDLAKDLNKTMKDHYDRARQHEVSDNDAKRIVTDGWNKSVGVQVAEADLSSHSKPRP